MEENQKVILRSNRTKLMENISTVNNLVNKLYENKLFTRAAKQEIEAERTADDKIGKILDILPTKGAQAFEIFYNCLNDTENFEAAEILKPGLRTIHLQHDGPGERQIVIPPQDDGGRTQNEIKLPEDWPNEEGVTADITVQPCDSDVKKYLNSPEVYSLKKRCRGRCFILSNKIFDKPKDNTEGFLPDRDGTEADVTRLEELFTQLHFKVIIHKEKTAQAVKNELSEEAKHSEQYEAECFVCVICSHGDENGIFGVDGGTVTLTEITSYFDGRNCKGLQSKPKLFFIQACQGGKRDMSNVADGGRKYGQDLRYFFQETDESSVTDDLKQQVHTKTDLLVACATYPGYVSIRNISYGTWFIQSVIYIFQKYACTKDINDLLTLVNRLVSKCKTTDGVIQASEWKTTLTKTFYFFPGMVEGE